MNSPNKKVIGFAALASRVQALPDAVWLKESAGNEPEERAPTPAKNVRAANNKLRRFDDGSYVPPWWSFKITAFKVLIFLFLLMLFFGMFSKK